MTEPTYYQLQKHIEKLQGDLAQARMERDTYGESVRMLSEDAKRMRERIVELEKQNETARQQVQALREVVKALAQLFTRENNEEEQLAFIERQIEYLKDYKEKYDEYWGVPDDAPEGNIAKRIKWLENVLPKLRDALSATETVEEEK